MISLSRALIRLAATLAIVCHAMPAAAQTFGPSPTISPATVTESTNGQGTVITVPVTLSPAPTEPFSVAFSTVPIVDFIDERRPASPGLDYVETAGTLVFQPGQTQASFRVTVIDDAIDEPTEFIAVAVATVTGPRNAVPALLNVLDDDAAPVAIPDVGFVNEQEGAVIHVPVKLQGSSAFDILIDWQTLNVPDGPPGQALSPDDYTAASGTLRIPAGRSVGVIDVPVRGDTLREPDEFIVVSFSNPRGATLGGFFGLGFGVILDGSR